MFCKTKVSPIRSFWNGAAAVWRRQALKSKKDTHLHLHSPFFPMLYSALMACECPSCLSMELFCCTGRHCHSSCGCSVLWPKLWLPHSRSSSLLLGEVSHGWLLYVSYICCAGFQICPAWLLITFLIFGTRLSRGSALPPHGSALGQETMSAQSCHPACFIALWNLVRGWSFHRSTTGQFLDILCSEFVTQGSYKLGIWDTPQCYRQLLRGLLRVQTHPDAEQGSFSLTASFPKMLKNRM